MDNIYDILNKFNAVADAKPRQQISEGVMEVAIEEIGGTPVTAKQKAFAKLAPPADKITFADKIAGAKKEVDEMLGDVAAEAMKKAVVGLKNEAGMEEDSTGAAQRKIIKKNGRPVGEVGIDPDAPPGRPGQWYMKHYASGHNLGGYDSREEAMSELKHCLSQDMEEGSTGDYSAAKARAGKDIGKPGKQFAKIAKSAAERYGSKERGEKVAGAVLAKLRKGVKEDDAGGIRDDLAYEIQAILDSALSGQNQTDHIIDELGDISDAVQGSGDRLAMKALEIVGDGIDADTRTQILLARKALRMLKGKAVQEADMEEGNDFTGARLAAIKAGKPTFSVAGKTYKVTGDTSDEKMMEKKEKVLWPGTPEYEKKFPKDMRPGEKKKSSTGGTIEKTDTGVKHTAKAHDDEDETDGKADDGAPKKKGRPKGSKRALGAKVKGTSKLHRKPSIREEGDEAEDDDVKQAMALLKKHGYKVSKDLEEKAVSKAQQRFMGMVHAAQKGEKPASKEVAKVAKEMPKKAAKDYAKTKHAGLPEKVKAKKEESKEEVEETTTSGSVATAPAEAPKGKKGMVFGKGVYEGYEQRFKQLLTEGMSINASQNEDGSKSLTVNATDEDAVKLAQILKLAGMEQAHGYEEACPTCGQAPCGCEGLEEGEYANSPEEVGADINTLVNTYSDGLNGQKTTGQTTIPVIAGQTQRMVSQVREEAESRLWDLYKRYDTK